MTRFRRRSINVYKCIYEYSTLITHPLLLSTPIFRLFMHCTSIHLNQLT